MTRMMPIADTECGRDNRAGGSDDRGTACRRPKDFRTGPHHEPAPASILGARSSLRAGAVLIAILVIAVFAGAASAQTGDVTKLMPDLSTPKGVSGAMNWVVLITVLAVAPAVLVLVTCFTRVIVVLGLLRQALSTQQAPPNQVLLGLSLLITIVVMTPVFQEVNRDAIAPYLANKMPQDQAIDAGLAGVRKFMISQVENARNEKDVHLFLDRETAARTDLAWKDVPTPALIAGYVLSELKVAFMIGVRIFLPFVIIDLLVASVLTSMGMLMLPPVLVSLPLKLLLFVLADGWHLVVGTLMRSVGWTWVGG